MKALIEELKQTSHGNHALDCRIYELIGATKAAESEYRYWNSPDGERLHADELVPAFTQSWDATFSLVPKGWKGYVEFGYERQVVRLTTEKPSPSGSVGFSASALTGPLALSIAALECRASLQ